MRRLIQSTLIVAVVAALTAANAQAAPVGTLDIVNSALSSTVSSYAGTPLHSNGGLDPDNYTKLSSSGVSVALRSRPVDGIGQPSVAPKVSGTATGLNTYNVGANGQFTVDFDFVPKNGAEFETDNYFVKLELDNDASVSTKFEPSNTFQGFVFDGDMDDELLDSGRFGSSVLPKDSSWDDGDSVWKDGVSTRGTGTNPPDVDFAWTNGSLEDLPEYVLSNSWNAQWDFPNPDAFSLLGDDFGGNLPAGLYNIRLSVYEEVPDNNVSAVASVEITAQVVPTPTAAFGGLMLLGGLALRRRRRVV